MTSQGPYNWSDLTQARKDKIVQSYYACYDNLNIDPVVIDLTTDVIDLTVSNDELTQADYGPIEPPSPPHIMDYLPGPTTVVNNLTAFTKLSIYQQANALEGFVVPQISSAVNIHEWEEAMYGSLIARALTTDEVLPAYSSSSQDTESEDATYEPMDVDSWTFSSDEGYESHSSDSIFIEY